MVKDTSIRTTSIESLLPHRYFILSSLLALFLFAYLCHSALFDIFTSWEQEEYSYAYFVLPLAILLGLHRLAEKPEPIQPSSLGLLLVVPSLLFWLVGQKSGIYNLPQYGALGLFYGLFICLLGQPITKRVLPALGYLFFAIPLPTMLYVALSARLQLYSSDISAVLLQALGVSVFQNGNILELGTRQLSVEEACSGLRYLFPLLSFGYLFSVIFRGGFWKKACLFVTVFPLVIVINVIRITSLGLIVNYGGSDAAMNFVHDIEGYGAFFLCLLILYGEVALFARIDSSGKFLDHYLSLPRPPFLLATRQVKGMPTFMILSLLVLFSSFFAVGYFYPTKEVIPQRSQFTEFPALSGWSRQDQFVDEQTRKTLRAHDLMSSNFLSDDGKNNVDLFIAYYEKQRERNPFHSPMVCLPGSGWAIREEALRVVDLPSSHGRAVVNRLVIEKGEDRLLIYYWYEQRGRAVTSYAHAKVSSMWDSITKGRTDGAMIRLTTPISIHKEIDEADARLVLFLDQASPVMGSFLPNFSFNVYGNRGDK